MRPPGLYINLRVSIGQQWARYLGSAHLMNKERNKWLSKLRQILFSVGGCAQKTEVSHTTPLPRKSDPDAPSSLPSGSRGFVLTVFLRLLSCSYRFILKSLWNIRPRRTAAQMPSRSFQDSLSRFVPQLPPSRTPGSTRAETESVLFRVVPAPWDRAWHVAALGVSCLKGV